MEIGNSWLINYNRVLIPNSPQETTNALTFINDLMCLALSLSTLAKLASTSTPPHPIHLIHHHCPWLQNLWSLLLLLLICNVDVVGKSVGLGKLTRLFFHNLENLQFRCDLSFVLYEMVQTYPVVTVCHDGLVMCIHTTRITDVVLKMFGNYKSRMNSRSCLALYSKAPEGGESWFESTFIYEERLFVCFVCFVCHVEISQTTCRRYWIFQ